MEKSAKRMIAMMLAAFLVIGVTGQLATPVRAAEPSGSYVLHFNDLGQPYLYGSRYEYKHSYDDHAGTSWTYWYAGKIFNLIYHGPEGDHSVAAYCTDVATDAVEDTDIYYRRINLEDSSYHDAGAAPRLRAVLLHSFPYLSVETVAANVNGVLGEGSIQNLNQGEVIAATQQAIWEITHGELYNVDQNYTGLRGMDNYETARFVHPESLEGCVESEFTATNIQNLYQYFLNLEGQAPLADAVSEFSFKNVVYDAVREEDGTYTVTVHYTIDAQPREGDVLVMQASCGDQVQELEFVAGDGSVVFSGIAQRENVTLTVSGHQTGADVYLFDVKGDRSVSQSMVGYDSTTQPVFAQVVAEPDRVIHIYKSTNEGENKRPLANIEFEIYQVALMDDIVTGNVQLGEKPTDEEVAAYTANGPIVTLKTDAQGFASWNFTENDYPDGVYLVVEKRNPAVAFPVDPFYVAIPGTNEDGTGHAYTVTVHPKNTVEVGPAVRKDVTEIENDEDSFDVDQIHSWIIRGDIPAGMANAVKYLIRDTLDYRLTLKNGFEVKVGQKTDEAGDEAVTLTPGTDYAVTTASTVDQEGRTVDAFTVALTDAGMQAVANAAGNNRGDCEVRVYFNAVIDSDAQMGVEIPNQAQLDYINGAGIEYKAESDIPKVYTGGTGILKLDSGSNAALKDAAFKIARDATEEEIADGDAVSLTVGEEEKQVVFASFYTDEALTNKAEEATTAEDGRVLMYGLAYGTYYIVETKAPEDYNLLTEPVTVEIDADSHTQEQTVTVYNTKFLLPETGGMGTTLFTVFGLVFIGGAFALGLSCVKKKEI